MKKKITLLSIALSMALLAFTSCSIGKGDQKDRNLEQAMLAHLDSVDNVSYVGMSDVRELGDNRLQAVIIYYVTDSVGNRAERNARVTANDDCSEILTWEDFDSEVLGDAKQMVVEKFEEKGVNIDDGLIDALIELKRR